MVLLFYLFITTYRPNGTSATYGSLAFLHDYAWRNIFADNIYFMFFKIQKPSEIRPTDLDLCNNWV